MEYCNRMYKLYNKVSPHEQIVGWFSTFPQLDSVLLSLHQVLASRYYKTVESPFVYLALDPEIKASRKISIKVSSVTGERVDLLCPERVYDLSFSLLLHGDLSHPGQGRRHREYVPRILTRSIVNTVLYGQKYKDPLSLIMQNVDEETYTTAEVRSDEAVMSNAELIKTSLEELHGLLRQAEEYMDKVAVCRGG